MHVINLAQLSQDFWIKPPPPQSKVQEKTTIKSPLHAVKRGRPNPQTSEWTIMSAIWMKSNSVTNTSSSSSDSWQICALGTGSKCLGSTSVSPWGDTVNDCHSEVTCRRAFLLFLYTQLKLAIAATTTSLQRNNNNSSDTHDGISSCIFESHPTIVGKWRLKSSITFHMYVSQAFCGDASTGALDELQSQEERRENEAKKREWETKVMLDGGDDDSFLLDRRRHHMRQDQVDANCNFEEGGSSTPNVVLRGRLDYGAVGALR